MFLLHALVLMNVLGPKCMVFAEDNPHTKQQYCYQHSYYCNDYSVHLLAHAHINPLQNYKKIMTYTRVYAIFVKNYAFFCANQIFSSMVTCGISASMKISPTVVKPRCS